MGAPAWSRTLPSILPVELWPRSEPAPPTSATAAYAMTRATRAKALTRQCFMDTSSKGVNLRVRPTWSGERTRPPGPCGLLGMHCCGSTPTSEEGRDIGQDIACDDRGPVGAD